MSNLKKIPLAQTTMSNDFTDAYKAEIDTAYTNNHTHSNKSSLDLITSLTSTNATALLNLSGTNSGDETRSGIISKLGGSGVTSIGTCSTASATAEKAVILSGFTLTNDACILVTFSNTNSAASPTLNVNSTEAKPIISEDGATCSATNPFYVQAGTVVEFTYNGTNWIYKNKVITNYVNDTSWYRVWSNGWIEQGNTLINSSGSTNSNYVVTFTKAFSNASYTLITSKGSYNDNAPSSSWVLNYKSKTASNFTIGMDNMYYTPTLSYYACGY